MIKVLIADDHKIVRDGLKALLTQMTTDMHVVGETTTGQQVLTLLENVAADIILMDIDMPEMNGIEATRMVREKFPAVKVLMLTIADNEQWVKASLDAGAQGYVLKSAGRKELFHAIRAIAEGEEYFSSELTRMLLGKVPQTAAGQGQTSSQAQPVNISARELEVLRLIAKGYTNQQIGDLMFVSKRTVDSHRQNLLDKTGTANTASLIRYALMHGYIT